MEIKLNPGESLTIKTEKGVVQISYLPDIQGEITDNVMIDIGYDRSENKARVERINKPFPSCLDGDNLTTACNVIITDLDYA